ncbi:hypothetical protein PybrP1_001005 [[Pythium] brassicae (nom. inval.)]|nr:hypothetical protein PybrP1_001005 [[Pythium] brassicae (nom. inval.)]
MAVEAVTSICHQAVKSRFALALPFFRKIIRKLSAGFTSPVLHATLKSVIFIGDFDSSLVKVVEDELVCNVMSRYENDRDERFVAAGKLTTLTPACSASDIAREFVIHLVDDASSGVEIANATEKMLGVFKEDRMFGQTIRRFVFATVNSIVLIWFGDVFRATLTLISTLWNHYRRHLKVELALMFEHVFLRILRTNALCASNHQMDIMRELTPWIQLPHNLVEIFLNFDMDRVQQWKIFE